MDAVVDCVGRAATRNSGEEIITSVSKAAQKLRPQGAPKLTYVYTSGSWVHGDNRTDIVTDTTPIKSPPQFLTWRLDREQLVLTDKNVNGLVIRPALLYGRSGSLLAPFFKSASEGHVWYPGTPAGRFTLVHADDLADLYVKATEKGAISRGLIFEGANDITESVDDVLSALVKVSGAKAPYEYKEPVDCMFFPLLTLDLQSLSIHSLQCTKQLPERPYSSDHTLPGVYSAGLQESQVSLTASPSTMLHGRLPSNEGQSNDRNIGSMHKKCLTLRILIVSPLFIYINPLACDFNFQQPILFSSRYDPYRCLDRHAFCFRKND